MIDHARPIAASRRARFTVLVLFVVALLSVPFVIWGEDFAIRILGGQERQAWAMALIGIALLTADSVAPIPSSIVIVAVALKAGWIVGTIAGTIGLCGQVVGAAWFGQVAIGKVAGRLIGFSDRDRLRVAVQQRLALTLGCFRSVPLLAETSVVIAASLGIPLARIWRATVLPNLAIAATYSVAAETGLWAAGVAVVASIAISLLLWRIAASRGKV